MDSIFLIFFNEENYDWRKEDSIYSLIFFYEEVAIGGAL